MKQLSVLLLLLLLELSVTTFSQTLHSRREAKITEVTVMLTEIDHRMSPYTLDEAKNGITSSETYTSDLIIGNSTVRTRAKTRKIGDSDSIETVSAYTKLSNSNLDYVVINVKKGAVTASDYYNANVGHRVLMLEEPNAGQFLGFDRITFIDNDIYTTYDRQSDGKWFIEKYRKSK